MDSTDRLVGATLGDGYVVHSLEREDALGRMYTATHPNVPGGRFSALVVSATPPPGDPVWMRFQSKAHALRHLKHPRIAHARELGQTPQGEPFVIFVHPGGVSLAERLAGGAKLDASAASHLVRQLCQALALAHRKAVVHHDVRPENVFVSGELGHLEVTLFGFGTSMFKELVLKGGEPPPAMKAFLAPEQRRGEPCDHRADVYAVGALLFTVLTGQPPPAVDASTVLTPARRLEPTIPESFEAAISKAMAAKPAERFHFLDKLEAALGSREESDEDLDRMLSGFDAAIDHSETPAPVEPPVHIRVNMATLGAKHTTPPAKASEPGAGAKKAQFGPPRPAPKGQDAPRPEPAKPTGAAAAELQAAIESDADTTAPRMALNAAGELPAEASASAGSLPADDGEDALATVVRAPLTPEQVRAALADAPAPATDELLALGRGASVLDQFAAQQPELQEPGQKRPEHEEPAVGLAPLVDQPVAAAAAAPEAAEQPLTPPITPAPQAGAGPSAAPRRVGGLTITVAVGILLGLIVAGVFALRNQGDAVSSASAPPPASSPPTAVTTTASVAPAPAPVPTATASAARDTARAAELLERMLVELRDSRNEQAIGTLDELAKADPGVLDSVQARIGLTELLSRTSALPPPTRDRAFALAGHELGSVGLDVLYEIMTTRGGGEAASRAERQLQDPTAREQGTAALRIAYDLRMARDCPGKLALLDRARQQGDRRAQLELVRVRDCEGGAGCCLRDDPRIGEVVAAISGKFGIGVPAPPARNASAATTGAPAVSATGTAAAPGATAQPATTASSTPPLSPTPEPSPYDSTGAP